MEDQYIPMSWAHQALESMMRFVVLQHPDDSRVIIYVPTDLSAESLDQVRELLRSGHVWQAQQRAWIGR